jgi:hypothetical protein
MFLSNNYVKNGISSDLLVNCLKKRHIAQSFCS